MAVATGAAKYVVGYRALNGRSGQRYSEGVSGDIVTSDLIHWGCHSVLNLDRPPWNEIKLGGGTPPMRTEAGWLTIYHGNKQSPSERNTGRVGTYIVGAMLLDLECPERVIGFTREPIMVAEYPFEKDGFVNNVLFPTGLIARDGRFRMYYGAADSSVGLAEFSRERLLDSIEPI